MTSPEIIAGFIMLFTFFFVRDREGRRPYNCRQARNKRSWIYCGRYGSGRKPDRAIPVCRQGIL